MKGELNYTLKKLIELSLTIGKAPVIAFEPFSEIVLLEYEEIPSPETTPFIQVPEPTLAYKTR